MNVNHWRSVSWSSVFSIDCWGEYFTEEENQSLSFFMFMIVEIIYVKYVNEATCINHEVLCAERIVCLHCSWCLYIHFSLMFRLVLDQIWYISRQSELLRNIWFLNGILINNLSWSSKLLYIAFDEKKIKLKIGLFFKKSLCFFITRQSY